jgi:hypothetical protein
MRYPKKLSIHLFQFEAWCTAIAIRELRKTLKQHWMHVRYPMMHIVSHISESIWQMNVGDNFTTEVSD